MKLFIAYLPFMAQGKLRRDPTVTHPLTKVKPPSDIIFLRPTSKPTKRIFTKYTPTSSPTTCEHTDECELDILIDLMETTVSADHRLLAQWTRAAFHDVSCCRVDTLTKASSLDIFNPFHTGWNLRYYCTCRRSKWMSPQSSTDEA